MSFPSLVPACRICKKSCLGNIKCDKCQSLYYCSEACKIKDEPDHYKACMQRPDDEKLLNLKELQKQLNDAMGEINEDLLGWKNTESYKTGILTEFMIIHFQKDGAIVTAIAEISISMKAKIDIFWPKINPKESIPIQIMNSKCCAKSRINLWPGF
jgi:hypothetical protein